MRFTKQSLDALKAKDERYEIAETNGKGLAVRVTPKGTKTFIYRYRHRGRARRMTLGAYPENSLKKVHNELLPNARKLLEAGTDPGDHKIAEKQKEYAANTVGELVTLYIDKYAKREKRTWKEDDRMLKKDVLPYWKHRKAEEIRRLDVTTLLDRIVDRGAPITANRTFEVVSRIFSWAVSKGYLDNSPCFKMEQPAKTSEKRERTLTGEEIKILWNALDDAKMTTPIKLGIKLLLVTGQRRGEVAEAKKSEFDLDSGWWTIPAERTKNGKPHRIPLTALSIDLVQQLIELSGDEDYLIPSPRGEQAIRPGALTKAIDRTRQDIGIEHFTIHDLRRTVATNLGEMAVNRLHIEKILNHSDRSVTAVYDRHTYDKEKKEALDLWDSRLNNFIKDKDDNIVYLGA